MAIFPELGADLSKNDNRLHMIVFEDVDLSMKIGVYPEEKRQSQRVIVSVALLILPTETPREDRIERVVDYSIIHDGIVALAAGPHVNLQETLAEAVAALCLAEPRVQAVEVYVRKPDAYIDCLSVGLRIVRTRTPRA